MDRLEGITVTDIEPPVTIFSAHGRTYFMDNRPSWGLSFCSSGQISYVMDGKTYLSDSEHAVLLPKGGSYTLYGDREGLFPLINFQCTGLAMDTIAVFPLKNPRSFLVDYELLKGLFLFPGNKLKIYSSFYALLDRVFQDQQPRRDILYPAMQYIQAHLADPELSVASLAAEASISEVYFRKLFLAQYDITPKQYILNIRIQRAKDLLSGSGESVSAIAEKCGFSSLYHFCRIFKNKTGTTPTQYARENRRYRI